MKQIPLSQGKVALVDDEWFEELSKVKWCAALDGEKKIWYAVRSEIDPKIGEYRTVRMHRIIARAEKKQQVDHWDHDGLNNVTSNLRVCTLSNNAQNRRKFATSSSVYKGITWNKARRMWRVSFRAGEVGSDGRRKPMHFGFYSDEVEAAKAYDRAARIFFGEFACTNFPIQKEEAA
jgi:hypothetical protein